MANAHVQTIAPASSGVGAGNGAVINGAAASQTLASPTTSGNLLVVIYEGYSADNATTSLSFTDNKGNTFVRILEVSAGGQKAAMFYAKNISGGSSHTVTCRNGQTSGSSQDWGVFSVTEVSGADTAAPLNTGSVASGTGSFSNSTSLTSGTLINGDIVFAALSCWEAGPAFTSPGAPWNTVFNRNDGVNDTIGVASRQIVAAATPVAHSVSLASSASSTSKAHIIAAFTQAGSAPVIQRPLDRPNLPSGMTLANWRKALTITGPLYMRDHRTRWGTDWQTHESVFAAAMDYQWNYWETLGNRGATPIYDIFDFYDRAKIYYMHYFCTGDTTSLSRANTIAVDFRDTYCVGSSYVIQDYWAMMEGLALHYLVTGDTTSRTVLGKVADRFRNAAYHTNLMTAGDVEGRVPAYLIKASVLADIIGAPSDYGYNWKTVADYWVGLTRALYNSGTGKYSFVNPTGNPGSPTRPQKPWMTCLSHNSYMLYMRAYGFHSGMDTDILGAMAWIDANAYDSGTTGFKYAEFDYEYTAGNPATAEGSAPTAELNGMMCPSYGYWFARTGLRARLTRMLACFASGNVSFNPTVSSTSPKLVNQNFQYANLTMHFYRPSPVRSGIFSGG